MSPLKDSYEGQTASLSFLGKSYAACVPVWTQSSTSPLLTWLITLIYLGILVTIALFS